ncbi:MAG: hypothetical protein ACRDLK_07585, partial [Gaiellaceae bacterium]
MKEHPRPAHASAREAAKQQSIFREVNERIEELAGRFDVLDQTLNVVCECGDGACTERIELTASEYEALRGSSRRFAVVPGHE